MTTYIFETITAAQALSSFTASSDTLIFTNPTSTANKMSVLYNAATATQAATVTVLDNVTGRSVVFGTTAGGTGVLTDSDAIFPDGSKLFIGSTDTTTGDTFSGGAGTASSRPGR